MQATQTLGATHPSLLEIIQMIFEADGDISSLSDEILTLSIKVTGDKFHSSITGEMARSLWVMQESLYRAAAEIIHGQANIRKLSAEEREKLTLSFQINPGCTDVKACIKRAITEIGKGFQTMESKDKRTTLIAIAVTLLLGFSAPHISSAIQNYNHDAAMVKQAEVLTEPLKLAFDFSATEVAKSAKTADEVKFGQEHRFDKSQIENLNKKSEKQKAITNTFDSTFRVVGVDLTKDQKLRVHLIDESGVNMFATVPRDDMFGDIPSTASDVAKLIGIENKYVRATILVRETKTKVENVIVSWEEVELGQEQDQE